MSRPDETFKVDPQTADRIKRLAQKMECGWMAVIREAVFLFENEFESQLDFERRMNLQKPEYVPPREFAGDDEMPF